jgi:glycosyltransferase involved in cell wall biosynthesis
MNPQLSVVIPTHNPDLGRLKRTLAGLAGQTLPMSDWETILVNNASSTTLEQEELQSLLPNLRSVTEAKLGLTYARLTGFKAAHADLLVLVDDDNVLDPSYLKAALGFAEKHPQIGTFGGKSLPEFESPPPPWFERTGVSLGCRDRGDAEEQFIPVPGKKLTAYPPMSPIGAGMVLRRGVADAYRRTLTSRTGTTITDRRGAHLSSAGDCDIVLCGLLAGWGTAYSPTLRLTHIIPASRLTPEYLRRIAHASFRDYVRVLVLHGISPWPQIPRWTVPLRQIKAWLALRAWHDPANSVRWHGIRGQIEGRAVPPLS